MLNALEQAKGNNKTRKIVELQIRNILLQESIGIWQIQDRRENLA